MKVPSRSSAQIRSHAQKVLGSDEELPLPGSSGGSVPRQTMSEDNDTEKIITENKQESEMSESHILQNSKRVNLTDLNTIQQNIAAQRIIS